MVRKIDMFEAADGSTHRSKDDAVCADLVHLLKQCGGINDASAAQLVSKVKQDDDYRAELSATMALLEVKDGAA